MGFVGFDVEGEENLARKLKLVSDPRVASEMTLEVAKEVRQGMQRSTPSRKYVTRKAAYGKTFFSERQRRWFFANLGEGLQVPYKRTDRMRRNWDVMPFGASNHLVVNDSPGAEYVFGDQTQSRHEAMVGWKTIGTVVRKMSDRIRFTANKVLDAYLRKVGLR